MALAKLRGAFTFNACNGMVRKLLPLVEQRAILLIDLTTVGALLCMCAWSMSRPCVTGPLCMRSAARRPCRHAQLAASLPAVVIGVLACAQG